MSQDASLSTPAQWVAPPRQVLRCDAMPFLYPQARQKWHITLDRSFPATVNLRNEAMMKEAGDFALHLRRCEKDIRALKNATEGKAVHAAAPAPLAVRLGVQTNCRSAHPCFGHSLLGAFQPPQMLQNTPGITAVHMSVAWLLAGLLLTTKLVLSAPLPRVYEDTGNGRVVATPAGSGEPDSNRIGGDFKVDELTRVSRETVRHIRHGASYLCLQCALCICCCAPKDFLTGAHCDKMRALHLHGRGKSAATFQHCCRRGNWTRRCSRQWRDGTPPSTQWRCAALPSFTYHPYCKSSRIPCCLCEECQDLPVAAAPARAIRGAWGACLFPFTAVRSP